MKIDSNRLKTLRAAKNWSQEQLSEACGLSLRTIQRLENGGNASIESVRALAEIYDVNSTDLILSESDESMTPFEAVKMSLFKFSDFSGVATRYEYGWFFLFVVITQVVAILINLQAYQVIAVLLIVPFVSASTRRLHDAGSSGWWQLLWFVPYGQIVVLYLLAQPHQNHHRPIMNNSLDTF
ncbi:MAG: DUF805 domain-containing protein [Phototrophicaceae bacterium]